MGKEKEMSKDKVDKSLGAKRLEKHLKDETKKGKKMSEIFREAREGKKKPTTKPRSGGAPILDIKSITGRPDPTKKNFMAGGMVNPSYGTDFDDR
jgi:predicted transcriptional regulator